MIGGAPVFFLLAGPNGAGKSTLYKALLANGTIPAAAEFINADLHEAAHLQHIVDPLARSGAARLWADERRAHCLRQGKSFASETVFSHESKLALIDHARAAGFFVTLLVVGLDHPERLLGRVRYDSEDIEPGTARMVAWCKGRHSQELVAPMPAWARQVLLQDDAG